ncbi:MAG: signal recognition particle-docking protein FtsY [Polyangiaceae bacterium]
MTYVYIAVAAVLVLAALYFLVFNKKEAPKVEDVDEPKAKPAAAEPPKAATKPKEPVKEQPKEAPKPAKKVEEAPKPRPEPAEAKKPSKPAPPKEEEEDEAGEDEEPEVDEEPVVAKTETKKPEPRTTEEPKARPAPAAKRAKDVGGLRKGLAKTRGSEGFFGKLRSLFSGKKEIDPNIVEQIEEVLLTSDVGVKTTELLVGSIKESLAKNELKDEGRVWDALRAEANEIVGIGGGGIALSARPTVVMVVGVNGVGKTTTIGKLATRLTQQGKKVVLAAGDTFRAAAVQQLSVWGKRVDCEVVSGAEGANPAAVIFDAVQRAKEIKADVVLADTAGRLHTKTNLMEELKKIHRTMSKAMEGAPHETLLVVDATNGQNATQQAAQFKEALPLSGIVLTKLDGTAKGGVVLSICAEQQIPVRYIGIGERAEDLRDFNGEEFVEALLGRDDERDEAAA